MDSEIVFPAQVFNKLISPWIRIQKVLAIFEKKKLRVCRECDPIIFFLFFPPTNEIPGTYKLFDVPLSLLRSEVSILNYNTPRFISRRSLRKKLKEHHVSHMKGSQTYDTQSKNLWRPIKGSQTWATRLKNTLQPIWIYSLIQFNCQHLNSNWLAIFNKSKQVVLLFSDSLQHTSFLFNSAGPCAQPGNACPRSAKA